MKPEFIKDIQSGCAWFKLFSGFCIIFCMVLTGCDGSGGESAGSADAMQTSADAMQTIATGQETSALVTADEGGTLELITERFTYSLDISPGAVTEDVTITMREATSPQLPSAAIVQLEPDGLQFAIPIRFTANIKPGDDVIVGLNFEEEARIAEAVLAAPSTGGGFSMPVSHFSNAALTPRRPALSHLDPEGNIVVSAAGLDALAFGLGEEFHRVVLPQIEEIPRSQDAYSHARVTLEEWSVRVEVAGLQEHEDAPGSAITLGDRVEEARARFFAALDSVYRDRMAPRCIAGRDIIEENDLLGWFEASTFFSAEMQNAGIEVPALEECAQFRLVLQGPATLAGTDETVTLSTRLELVGPTGVVIGVPNITSFAVQGAVAVGPVDVLSDAEGRVVNKVFQRPVDDRPPGVRIEVSVNTDASNAQFGGDALPEQVFFVQEQLRLTLTATPASLNRPGAEVEVCARLDDAAGNAISTFNVAWGLVDQVGQIDVPLSFTNTGSSCIHYTAPEPAIFVTRDVGIRAEATAPSGAAVSGTTLIHLVGNAELTVLAEPSTVRLKGTTQVCATLLSQGVAVLGAAINLSASRGVITGVVSTDVNGIACATFTAPQILGTVTVSASFAADGRLFSASTELEVVEGLLLLQGDITFRVDGETVNRYFDGVSFSSSTHETYSEAYRVSLTVQENADRTYTVTEFSGTGERHYAAQEFNHQSGACTQNRTYDVIIPALEYANLRRLELTGNVIGLVIGGTGQVTSVDTCGTTVGVGFEQVGLIGTVAADGTIDFTLDTTRDTSNESQDVFKHTVQTGVLK